MDPKEIKDMPNGSVRKFAGEMAMDNANAYRAMIYRAGRRAERSRVFYPKTQETKVHVTIFDKGFKK